MNLSNTYRTAAALRAATLALLLGAAGPLAAQTASGKFLQTFLLYYGGGPTLVASDAARLAKFDLLNFDRFRYNQIGPNRSEEHTSELQSLTNIVCRLLLEKKKIALHHET